MKQNCFLKVKKIQKHPKKKKNSNQDLSTAVNSTAMQQRKETDRPTIDRISTLQISEIYILGNNNDDTDDIDNDDDDYNNNNNDDNDNNNNINDNNNNNNNVVFPRVGGTLTM